jgi:MYXO-CTERM domain-containing protein
MHRIYTLLPLLICATSAMAGPDFVGAYAPAMWSTTGILGGAAEVDVASSSASELVLTYDVDLGYPSGGVTFRTALYETTADANTDVTFDWDMVYDARIHQPRTDLYVYAEGPTGAITEVLLHTDLASFGSEVASGVSPIVQVYAGRAFGIRAGGGNLDADSRISGTVTLTNFNTTNTADCAGTPGGSATVDMCGVCDTNPANDCLQDCRGDWGGAARVDNCGTCDANPSNDCAADCNGVFGGLATVDMCGACDSNPGNDCAQDCLGIWGGIATVDGCGTCDSNPANNCVQDCRGDWGGTATVDACGTCDANPGNDCELDCLGVPGGAAVQDMCGTCNANPVDDCEQDCLGVWGGLGVEDGCGDCDSDPSNDCEPDCNGDYDGTAYLDDCGDCVEGNTGAVPCETSTGGTTTPGGTTPGGGTTSGSVDNQTGNTGDTGLDGPGSNGPATFTRAGCGCASGSATSGLWLLGAAALWTRRR